MKFIKLNNQKRPMTPFNPRFYSDDYNRWNNSGFIIGNDVIVLDFDNDNPNEKEIVNYIEKEFPTLIIKTTRGKHFYYKMPSQYRFKKLIDGLSCLGFQCDYLTGEKSISTIKLNGQVREMNKEFKLENMSMLPKELYPLKKGKKLSGMSEGDGRNNSLYAHLLAVRESFPEIDINTLSDAINSHIFAKSMDKSELKEVIKSAKKKEVKINKRKEIIYSSFEELQNRNLPPIIFFVDKLIPQGLTLLCSLPKIGKSWLALDFGTSISNGTPIMGFKTKPSGVLYLALEDSENRLQDRINKVLKGKKASKNFMYSIRCDDIENGLIEELEDIIKREPHIKVIIIDTLQKVRSVYRGNNSYGHDYKEISKLKELADKNNMSIILIHHLKKGNEGDVFEKVSGTNGITGTADTTIVLEKEDRSSEDTTLSIVGRDVEYQKYIIRFNKETFRWSMISTYEEKQDEIEKEDYYNNPIVETIKRKLNENHGLWKTSCKELEKELFDNYSDMIDTTINQKRLNTIRKQLLTFDNITFFMSGQPVKGKRPLIFKKIVENVDSVDNSTNSTKSTKKEMYKNV